MKASERVHLREAVKLKTNVLRAKRSRPMAIVLSVPRRLQYGSKPLVFDIARSCHRALAVAHEGADSGSSATWSECRSGASTVESISCRSELEFSRRLFEAHGLLRLDQVHSIWRQPGRETSSTPRS